jgi:integrase
MSIERRSTKSGVRYEVRLRDAVGREYSRTFRTRKEADTFQARERADRSRGAWIDPRRGKTTFAQVAVWWLESNPAKRPGSRARDEGIIRLHLNPQLGERPIAAITPADVRRLVHLWANKYPASTTHRHFAVLRAICAAAVDADYLARTPCRAIKLPTIPPTQRPEVTPDDVNGLVGELGISAAFALVAAVLGLRWGECAGLRVGDIDFLRSRLRVAQQRAAGAHTAGEPKSPASVRSIAMPDELATVLAAHLSGRGMSGADTDALVFVGPQGEPLDYSNWRRRVWLPARRRAGLDRLTFQDLRRANATAMALDRVDAKTGSARLGHSDPRLYLEVYAQATGEGDRRAASKLGARFFPPPPTDDVAHGLER